MDKNLTNNSLQSEHTNLIRGGTGYPYAPFELKLQLHGQVSNPYNFNPKQKYKSYVTIKVDGYIGNINIQQGYHSFDADDTPKYYYGFKIGQGACGSVNPSTYNGINITGLYQGGYYGYTNNTTYFTTSSDVGYVCIKIDNTIVFKGYSGGTYKVSDSIFKSYGNKTLEIRSHDF